jgi:hypothetical protein
MRATIEVLLGTIFSTRSGQKGYKEKIWAIESVLYRSLEQKSSVEREPMSRQGLGPEAED